MNIPSDTKYIQPISRHVWNCDDIGFDPNLKCNRFICTYKLFPGEIIGKVQTGGQELFWCTLLVFNQSNGEFLMPPIIFYQWKDSSQDIQFNTPLYYISRHKPYGYMDKYGWLKFMTKFATICGDFTINNQIIFFNRHDTHFNNCALNYTKDQNIQPVTLKSGDSVNIIPIIMGKCKT